MTLPLSCVWFFIPLVRNHGTGVFPDKFEASADRLLFAYNEVWTDLAPLVAIAAIAIVLLGVQRSDPRSADRKWSSFSLPEGVLAAYLVLVPVFITLVFTRSHSAYFPRYGAASIIGMAVLLSWFFAYWTKMNRLAGLTCFLVFLLGLYPPSVFLRLLSRFTTQPGAAASYEITGESPLPLSQVQPELPLVDAGGLTFLEMDHQENDTFVRRDSTI